MQARTAPDAAAPATPMPDAEAKARRRCADTNDADAKDTDAQDDECRRKDADSRTSISSDLELDWSQLNVDASTLNTNPYFQGARPPQAAPSTEMSWSSHDKANGSSAVTVKQPLSTSSTPGSAPT